MEISSFLPSSDNLYKFLFMGGIFMIAFSFIYPLEKSHKIELEINLYNQQVELLNNEICVLNIEVENLKSKTKNSMEDLENQNKNRDKKTAEKNIDKIKEDYNKIFNETKSKQQEIIIKDIILKYEKQKIELLQSQVHSFSIFRWGFLIIGIIFTLFGIYRWYTSSSVSENIQKLELERKKKELR